MSLWKRTLMGTEMVVGTALVVVAASHLPSGMVPPVTTILAIVAIPIIVVGGSSVVRLSHRCDGDVVEAMQPRRLAVGFDQR